MSHKRPPIRILLPVLVLAVIGAYYGFRALLSGASGTLSASGTIEAVTVTISPEVAGRIVEVVVEEGEAVQRGAALLRLDTALITAQRDVAAAALEAATAAELRARSAREAAEAQYELALQAALIQDSRARSDWFVEDPEQFGQPGWYFSRVEQIEAARAEVEFSRAELESAQSALATLSGSLGADKFLDAEQRLLRARLAYRVASDVNDRAQNSTGANVPVGQYNRAHCGTNEGYRLDTARLTDIVYTCEGDPYLAGAGASLYASARDELDAAQDAYDALLSTEAAVEVLETRAGVSVAQERYYATLELLYQLQTADRSPAVAAAHSSLEQAQAAADQAAAAVSQARASLALIESQLERHVLYAPMDGVVLTRVVEPGEFVQPGSAALTMGDLGRLTITVYVPEDRYGEIHIGQQAQVSVDSFPGRSFAAEVTRIADEAEYTPRNVQTVEGRSSTVYAITLRLLDAARELNIGMPADVEFSP